MDKKSADSPPTGDLFTEMLRIQGDAAREVMKGFMPEIAYPVPQDEVLKEWGDAASKLQQMWMDQYREQQDALPEMPAPLLADPSQWMGMMQGWYQKNPLANPESQRQLWQEGMALWDNIMAQYGLGPDGKGAGNLEPELPRKDRRFADPAWRDSPVFALIHQTYLLLAERIQQMVDKIDDIDDAEREKIRFATRASLEAMSPANFPMMNPVVLEKTIENRGANLVKGMERLAHDLEKGQLTHTDNDAFRLGENIAATPGKVVHETPLYQIIQYTPTTENVHETPLIIFPPWINRFYILDLNEKKSFIRWAVAQGLTVFVVSWHSANEELIDTSWDDYIRAQIDVIDHVRERLDVPDVHTIGYCVAGTTLAATLAILAERGQADKVRSATFFTAQVDFEEAGELKVFIDDNQLEMVRQASRDGFLDGRYMAATFNLLRGRDLIWNYVVNHYLLCEDYPAFDLLHWNSDVTNLPAEWHQSYLRDLYRDNRLVQPGSLTADGTPIDLGKIKTPAYIQAGREDHIAPPGSVFRLTEHISGPARFVLAGSGHIAGVVNPPAAKKYQHWTSDEKATSLDDFIAKATEHPGSWWNDWLDWLSGYSDGKIPAKGKRKPGGKGDTVIEDAPGRYVRER
ncbi:PHA/PHB synthase family protein [Altericroceibacterium endophyticum]|nr:class I poly(R)-hydroxyalkanoic acid synthase [Altericroceibacterium endophyticum]